ncbi:MAG: tagaturonate epimerase family protein [Armatimonadetes bacterium]|nr:tagaturonate epimerase family protein [Armatimonadota bacterium]
MKFGKLEMNPAKNPGVLDTATWDRHAAWQAVEQVGDKWLQVQSASISGSALPEIDGVKPFAGSCKNRGAAVFCLAALSDGQQVFVEIGSGGGTEALGQPIGKMTLSKGVRVAAYPTDAAVVDRYFLAIKPDSGPQPWGDTPRLGIGVRMTTSVWPGIFEAMSRSGFAANSIQNSVRELNLLEDIIECRPAPKNYACGFGTIETGYTGSTWEGLWLSGVLSALQYDKPIRYGADADHIQIKRGEDGIARAKKVIDAARYYTFYTLDMADILDYSALADSTPAPAAQYLAEKIPSDAERRMILAYHSEPKKFGDRTYKLDEAAIGKFVGKYWDALHVLGELSNHLSKLKAGRPFDLEFTIDEHPPEIAAFDCLTTDEEVLFVLREIRRRGLPVTHIASNFGQEKGWDYRCPDGLDGLEKRVRAQFNIAQEFGAMLDFHSADDLTAGPRRVIQRATGGRHHYKLSPMIQLLYAEVLQDYHPELFRRWWDDAMSYARREAEAGSPFAQECVRAYEASADKSPSRHHMVFHHYSFAFVGRRDERGRFMYRDEFYDLSPEFYRAYQARISDYLSGLAAELF